MGRFKRMLIILSAIIVSILIVELFCSLYAHEAYSEPSKYHTTMAVRQPGFHFWTLREGAGSGVIDENGYNNSKTTEPIAVALIGDSHMQGLNVPQRSLVGERLKRDGVSAYNLGFAAETFSDMLLSLPYVDEAFHPDTFVIVVSDSAVSPRSNIIESLTKKEPPSGKQFSQSQQLLKHSYTLHLYFAKWEGAGRKLLATLRSLPEKAKEKMEKKEKAKTVRSEVAEAPVDAVSVDETEMLALARKNVHGKKIIIVNLPACGMQNDRFTINDTLSASFLSACKANDITVIDMGESFKQSTLVDGLPPYGFSNTAPLYGHLNATGHRLLEEALLPLFR